MADAAASSGLGPRVTLRPAGESDWPMIRRWLALPEVQAWWGSAASAEAEITIAMESPSGLCRIIMCGSEPVGYAQAIDAALLGTAPGALAPGTYDADAFIGSAAHRGQGAGVAALEQLAAEVLSTTLAVAVAVLVPVRHERVVRAYEKAGFRWAAVHEDPASGPSWVLIRTR